MNLLFAQSELQRYLMTSRGGGKACQTGLFKRKKKKKTTLSGFKIATCHCLLQVILEELKTRITFYQKQNRRREKKISGVCVWGGGKWYINWNGYLIARKDQCENVHVVRHTELAPDRNIVIGVSEIMSSS